MTEPILPKNVDAVEWVGPQDYSYAISGLIHCFRLPEAADDDRPVPAVVMVHGWGGDESVMWIFKQVLPEGVAIFTPRAPLELKEGGYSWFEHDEKTQVADLDSLEQGIDRLEQFVKSLAKLYPVQAERTLLMGFSQGAGVSNGLIRKNPQGIVGIASLSSLMPSLPDDMPQVEDLAGLPVFIAHGTEDETIPVSQGRHMRDVYTELGADVTYQEYKVGHKMTSQGLKDLTTWVAAVLQTPST